jgi:hypothetical protein
MLIDAAAYWSEPGHFGRPRQRGPLCLCPALACVLQVTCDDGNRTRTTRSVLRTHAPSGRVLHQRIEQCGPRTCRQRWWRGFTTSCAPSWERVNVPNPAPRSLHACQWTSGTAHRRTREAQQRTARWGSPTTRFQPAAWARVHRPTKSVSSSHTALMGPSESGRKPRTAESRTRLAFHHVDARDSLMSWSNDAPNVPSNLPTYSHLMTLPSVCRPRRRGWAERTGAVPRSRERSGTALTSRLRAGRA